MVIVVDRSVVGQDTLGVRLDPLVVWWYTILENVDIYLPCWCYDVGLLCSIYTMVPS